MNIFRSARSIGAQLTEPTTTARAKRPLNRRLLPLYMMLIPAIIGLILFHFYPVYGLIIAFQDFKPLLGVQRSPFVGLDNFIRLFSLPDTWNILRNTVFISIGKLLLGQSVSLTVALLLHEVTAQWFKRLIQSLTYVLYFLSWVVFGGIMLDLLSSTGLANQALAALGLGRVPFLSDPSVFPFTIISTDVWKEFGFGAIIYLAALTGVDPNLYEAAAVDGAGRWQRLRHITIPAILSTVVLISCLSLGGILNAGFEQILMLQNPQVLTSGDVIDTFVYRVGLLNYQYGFASAVGLLKSVVGFVLITASYWFAYRFADYRIF
jgi:putative aldouronate transport system permease protein